MSRFKTGPSGPLMPTPGRLSNVDLTPSDLQKGWLGVRLEHPLVDQRRTPFRSKYFNISLVGVPLSKKMSEFVIFFDFKAIWIAIPPTLITPSASTRNQKFIVEGFALGMAYSSFCALVLSKLATTMLML